MTIRYMGDLHGNIRDIGDALQSAESKYTDESPVTIIQVGDLGTGWPDKKFEDFLEKRARQGKWKVKLYSCLGNHDNYQVYDERCKEDPNSSTFEIVPGSGFYVVKRGHVIEIDGVNHIFMGGARSTDKHLRVEGRDWWAREEPSAEEFNLFYDNMQLYKPEVVVTHEAPLCVSLFRQGRKSDNTSNMLQKVLNMSDHQPKKLYFGHHHLLDKWKVNGIKFYCCGIGGEYWEHEKFPVEEHDDDFNDNSEESEAYSEPF